MSTPVQRWRIVYRRGPGASSLAQREELAAWESALAGSGLPLVTTGGERPRPRIVAAVPLPVGMTGAAEPLEILLTERRTRAEVRSAVEGRLPLDHALVDLHDVWLNAPSLPASIVAATYAVVVAAPDAHADAEASKSAEAGTTAPLAVVLGPAVERLLAADRLPRQRVKGDRIVEHDLRLFLLDLAVAEDPAGRPDRATLRMRLRVDPQLGAGRPDDVVAAAAEASGIELIVTEATRLGLEATDRAGR